MESGILKSSFLMIAEIVGVSYASLKNSLLMYESKLPIVWAPDPPINLLADCKTSDKLSGICGEKFAIPDNPMYK